MADINKLAAVQTAIDTLASGEGDLEKLGLSSLEQQSGSVTDDIDVGKIASVQSNITGITGSSIDLGGIVKIADCYKNLDDLLLEKAKQAAIDHLLANKEVSSLAQNIKTITDVAKAGAELMEDVNRLKEKSLVELLIDAKNAGILDRVSIVKKILDQYGDVVDDVNGLISNLANLDICSMTNYKTGGTAAPRPAKVVQAPPSQYPTRPEPMVFNTNAVNTKDLYHDAMFRLSDIVNSKAGLENNASSASMLTSLQHISRAYHDKIANSRSSGNDARFAIEFASSVEFEKAKNTEGWTKETLAEFIYRTNAVGSLLQKESDAIRQYNILRGDVSVVGLRSSSGVTIYGGPDWDFTTFLDIRPSERPPELVQYWTETRNRNIALQEQNLRSRGIKPGTLSLSDAYTGTYGRTLVAGKSCASTRYPGGSIIVIKNPDGTIFDPAGINPTGMYTVDDTGNAELTYVKVDLFINREHVDAYRNAKLDSAQVFLVQKGSGTSKQYRRAQERFA